MIAKVHSIIPHGYSAQLIEVEGDISRSLPCFNIVGMANKTVSEARERVRSAITNSSLTFPSKKVTVSLAPAEFTKDGSHLDLPIALAVLTLSQQILQSDLLDRIFVGELSLNGLTKPVRGIINITEAARDAGYQEIYLPAANLAQASLVRGIKIIGVSSLMELILHLKGIKPLPTHLAQNTKPTHGIKITKAPPCKGLISPHRVKNTATPYPLLDDIRGQEFVKRALTIAIAGRHNILLSGPPGAGKTLLAKAAANLLLPLSPDEQIEVTKIHALYSASEQVISTRPFRSPHHTASYSAIVGGGAHATPGEISLAHRGILFLDELPEYPRPVLEALRQPLEDRRITVSRLQVHTTYPADFMLIATMNPCPCGHLGDPNHPCQCSARQIQLYQKHLSGPILDRIDMIINVSQIDPAHLSTLPNSVKNTTTDRSEHATAQHLIQTASAQQFRRYQQTSLYNSSLTPQSISQYVKITPSANDLLQQAATSLKFSARVYFKIIKVAQTISDLEQSKTILPEHISEALSFRQVLP